MGTGSYTPSSYTKYAKSKGHTVKKDGSLAGDLTTEQLYTSTSLSKALNPYKVMRECCDFDEHPNTRPVILGLDVTGSMGNVATNIAKQLNPLMTQLFAVVPDIEFMTIAIGDLKTDDVPIQISQFESDIRIVDQLHQIYFEGHGGGNGFESYTAAWYMALRHTKMDCLKRGYKPLIITMGDEALNPYLPAGKLKAVTGDNIEGDIDTKKLYAEASKLFEIHHIGVGASFDYYQSDIERTWGKLLGEKYHEATEETITDVILNIVLDYYNQTKYDYTPATDPEVSEGVYINPETGGLRWQN